MSWLALLAALLWDYARPPLEPNSLARLLARVAVWLDRYANAGEVRHGLFAWSLGALLPALLVGAVGYALTRLTPLLGWFYGVGLLYLCLGYRRIAQRNERIVIALRLDDLDTARQELAIWRPRAGEVEPDADEVARHAIEYTLRDSLQRQFAVAFWFILLGPFGAALYFASLRLAGHWRNLAQAASAHADSRFADFASFAVNGFDWLPARMLALSFAIGGNFEGAMDGWRLNSAQWGDHSESVLLGAGAGALGIRLRAESHADVHDELDAEDRAATVEASLSLVRRAAVLWLAVLILFWLGSLAG